jgi:RimJ/RimL family protein N-acetyltransferase
VPDPTYPLRTPRLEVRPWVESDWPVYLRIRTDPEIARFIPWHPMAEDRARDSFDKARARAAEPGGGAGDAIRLAGTDVVVGTAGVHLRSEEHRQFEIGWILLPEHFGHGYATEASRRLLDAAFTDLGAHRVYADLDPRNVASAAVCQRLGMRREAVLRGTFREDDGTYSDTLVCAMLEDEWRELSAAS